jgi:hypothetical protein
MSDPAPMPTPPPEATAAPPLKTRRTTIHWQRVRIYVWAILLILLMWICGTMVSIRKDPKRFVDGALSRLPFPASVAEAKWINRRTLELRDVKLGDFFYAYSVTITASPFGLWRHHIAKVQIHGGQLYTKALYDQMEKNGKGHEVKGWDWTIARLEISRGTVMFESDSLDASIPVRLGAKRPIILNDIKLGAPDDSDAMNRERTQDIENVNIVSPFDPVAPVLAFPVTRIRFTYNELWHHHLREVEMIRPVMFLGEDLFWFSNQFKKSRATLPAEGVAAPWQIGLFKVEYGQLAVNAFGQPVVHFPFFYDTKVEDIRLDQLDKISAKSVIAIRRLDQDYPDYKIRIAGLTGRLYFSLPPTDATANNVVNTVAIDEVSWNNIPVKKVSTTVTFDPNGVYGKMSGACEGGELTGNFEFYYTKGFTWNVDFFANKINCQPIAEKVVGKYLNLTGELDGDIKVQGRVTEILDCQGLLTLPHPGLLQLKSLDSLLSRLPGQPTLLREQATKIAVDALSTYPYQHGELKIDYKPAGGMGSLSLSSTSGERHLDMFWHPYGSPEVAVAGDPQVTVDAPGAIPATGAIPSAKPLDTGLYSYSILKPGDNQEPALKEAKASLP